MSLLATIISWVDNDDGCEQTTVFSSGKVERRVTQLGRSTYGEQTKFNRSRDAFSSGFSWRLT